MIINFSKKKHFCTRNNRNVEKIMFIAVNC